MGAKQATSSLARTKARREAASLGNRPQVRPIRTLPLDAMGIPYPPRLKTTPHEVCCFWIIPVQKLKNLPKQVNQLLFGMYIELPVDGFRMAANGVFRYEKLARNRGNGIAPKNEQRDFRLART